MVPRGLYNTFEKFETPAIRLLNLAKPVLLLLASKSALLNSPKAVLADCMDPPEEGNVDGALEYLVGIGAAVFKPDGSSVVRSSVAQRARVG